MNAIEAAALIGLFAIAARRAFRRPSIDIYSCRRCGRLYFHKEQAESCTCCTGGY